VVPGHLDPLVPTCPEWTVGNLVQHVATTYLHKVATMRDGAFPSEWPPPGLNDEEPVALLDRAYAELVEEFSRREPEEFSKTWYEPDQSESPGRSYTINTAGVEWLVGTSPGSFTVGGGPGMTVPAFSNVDTAISGSPTAILRWVWNRETPAAPSPLTIKGQPDLTELRRCITVATQ